MATNKQRREATRASIMVAAREYFVREGYDQTHTDSILEMAGVSRGALYHHFPSKRDVFEAVYVAVVDESIERAMNEGKRGESAIEDLIGVCHAWLTLVRQPEIASILIEQGPQVLGLKKAREIEARSSLAPMRKAIERACNAGEMEVPSVEVTALLVNALLEEMALISVHGSPRISVAMQEATIRQFVEGLAPPLQRLNNLNNG